MTLHRILFNLSIVFLLLNVTIWGQFNDKIQYVASNKVEFQKSITMLPLATPQGKFRIRGGVGTDIEGELGFGGGFAYAWIPKSGTTAFEFGVNLYYANTTEQTIEDAVYDEETTVIAFMALANGLFNYSTKKTSVYFITGFGFAVAGVEWRETRDGNPYDDADGTAAGNVVNLGVGVTFGKSGLEARIETPMIYFYSTQGGSSAFVPAFTFNLLFRFG